MNRSVVNDVMILFASSVIVRTPRLLGRSDVRASCADARPAAFPEIRQSRWLFP